MAGTNITFTISDASLSLKWEEEYVSQGLNRATRTLAGHGVVRGFLPVPSALDRTLTLSADPATSDSAIVATGRTATDDTALMYREAGDVSLDLSALIDASESLTVAFVPGYTTSAITTANWRVYTDAEVTAGGIEADRAVVVCRVTAQGTVPNPFLVTDIETSNRDDLWKWMCGAQGNAPGEPPRLVDMVFNDAHTVRRVGGKSASASSIVPFGTGYWHESFASAETRDFTLGDAFGVGGNERLSYGVLIKASINTMASLRLRTWDEVDVELTPVTVGLTLPILTWIYNKGEIQVPSDAVRGELELSLTATNTTEVFNISRVILWGGLRHLDGLGAPDSHRRSGAKRDIFREIQFTHESPNTYRGFTLSMDDDVTLTFEMGEGNGDRTVRLEREGDNTLSLEATGQVRAGTFNESTEPALYAAFSSSLTTGSGRRSTAWRHAVEDEPTDETASISVFDGGSTLGATLELITRALGETYSDSWLSSLANAHRFKQDAEGFTLQHHAASGSFLETAWETIMKFTKDARLKLDTDTTSDSARIKLFESGANAGSSFPAISIYVNRQGIEICQNVTYDGANFNLIKTNKSAIGLSISDSRITILYHPYGLGASFSAWRYLTQLSPGLNDDYFEVYVGGSSAFIDIWEEAGDMAITWGQGYVARTSSRSNNPNASLWMANSLRAKNIAKVWGVIPVFISGTPTAPESITNADGYNITSARLVGNTIEVVVAADFEDDDYAVIACYDGFDDSSNYVVRAQAYTSGILRFEFLVPDGGTGYTVVTANAGRVSFVVFGIQVV